MLGWALMQTREAIRQGGGGGGMSALAIARQSLTTRPPGPSEQLSTDAGKGGGQSEGIHVVKRSSREVNEALARVVHYTVLY